MAIFVNESQRLFHLQTAASSYIFQILADGSAGQLYYGPRLPQQTSYPNLTIREERDATSALSEEMPDFQRELLKQEYSGPGRGDYRPRAFQLTYPNGSTTSEFEYQGYQITPGKDRLTDLPASFGDPATATTLTVTFKDRGHDLFLTLTYAVFPTSNVITRSTRLSNQGPTVTIDQVASAQLDLPDADYDLLSFPGSWARERHLNRHAIQPGTQTVASSRMASSHQENPFVILARPQTDNHQGAAIGCNLIYSGSFATSITVDQFATSRLLTGINPADFRWQLRSGTSFQTPEAVFTYTSDGLNALSQQLTDFYRDHLTNQHFARAPRPVLINNWEATLMNFTEQELMPLVKQAAQVGIELFVLDDGWFGHRNDDRSSLGDWFTNQPKFLNGIGGFAHRVHQAGLQFGLWLEPEMISLDSDLYQHHPDWLVQTPGRQLTTARHQYVLDLTQPAVGDYLFETISAIIQDTHLDYLKWDMNRNLTAPYSPTLPADRQGEFAHRYLLGVYRLYDRLTKAFPDLLIESCASGGGRFDLGMLYYAPQAWCSDDTDAIERLRIQDGSSYGYPLSSWGAHVSAVPNDQVGRLTPLATRAAVAYFGDFGYELDLNQLPASELAAIQDQVKFYKQYRQLFQQGRFYRLDRPQPDPNVYAWEVVNADRTQAIAARFQILNEPNPPYLRIYLTGLDPERYYQVNDDPTTYSGAELIHAGYAVPRIMDRTAQPKPLSDFHANLFVITAID